MGRPVLWQTLKASETPERPGQYLRHPNSHITRASGSHEQLFRLVRPHHVVGPFRGSGHLFYDAFSTKCCGKFLIDVKAQICQHQLAKVKTVTDSVLRDEPKRRLQRRPVLQVKASLLYILRPDIINLRKGTPTPTTN